MLLVLCLCHEVQDVFVKDITVPGYQDPAAQGCKQMGLVAHGIAACKCRGTTASAVVEQEISATIVTIPPLVENCLT